jgi:hypothetical protein
LAFRPIDQQLPEASTMIEECGPEAHQEALAMLLTQVATPLIVYPFPVCWSTMQLKYSLGPTIYRRYWA